MLVKKVYGIFVPFRVCVSTFQTQDGLGAVRARCSLSRQSLSGVVGEGGHLSSDAVDVSACVAAVDADVSDDLVDRLRAAVRQAPTAT